MTEDRAREWISTGLGVAVSAVTIYMLIRVMAGPDSVRMTRARVAKLAESFCQREAEGWAHMADVCSRVYEKSRAVNA